MLAPLMGSERHLRVHLPVALNLTSQPEPDLSVVRGKVKNYSREHPSPEDILLLIEVSDTTFRQDKLIKAALYSEAGIPELWILDLNRSRVVVHTGPEGRDYGSIVAFHKGDKPAPSCASDVAINLDDVLA
jgi:Uma2 family endonuclease